MSAGQQQKLYYIHKKNSQEEIKQIHDTIIFYRRVSLFLFFLCKILTETCSLDKENNIMNRVPKNNRRYIFLLVSVLMITAHMYKLLSLLKGCMAGGKFVLRH